MNVFFSDLDNTLIYSHRKHIDERVIPAELLNGKEQSYMTAETFSFLRNFQEVCLVPVTTRSEAQFDRLTILNDLNIEYALICNGGKLLIRGAEDRKWTEETIALVREDLPDLDRLAGQMSRLSGSELHSPEIYYYYVKAEDPERICALLQGCNRKGNISVEHDRRKVYLFPQAVNKGRAVRRFTGRYKTGVTVGAGDGLMDVSMLNSVDYALAPDGISGYVRGAEVRRLSGDIISDRICDELRKLRREGILKREEPRDD